MPPNTNTGLVLNATLVLQILMYQKKAPAKPAGKQAAAAQGIKKSQ